MDILLHSTGFGLVIASAVMLVFKKYDTGLYLFMAAFGVEAVRGMITHRDPALIAFALLGMVVVGLLVKRGRK